MWSSPTGIRWRFFDHRSLNAGDSFNHCKRWPTKLSVRQESSIRLGVFCGPGCSQNRRASFPEYCPRIEVSLHLSEQSPGKGKDVVPHGIIASIPLNLNSFFTGCDMAGDRRVRQWRHIMAKQSIYNTPAT
jgi:hypothetical protein